jgi:hypothetical protein
MESGDQGESAVDPIGGREGESCWLDLQSAVDLLFDVRGAEVYWLGLRSAAPQVEELDENGKAHGEIDITLRDVEMQGFYYQ